MNIASNSFSNDVFPTTSLIDASPIPTIILVNKEAKTAYHRTLFSFDKSFLSRTVYIIPTIKDASRHSLKVIINSFMT